MSPSFSLRRFTTSRLLRVMALLAWSLMTVSMPAVSAGVMAGSDHHVASMASMMMDHATHADATTADGLHNDHCCGDTTHAACHCEAMCAAALLPSVAALYGPTRLAVIRASMRSADAPTPDLIPPLRPPAV
ncbi:hypothetical protein [Dyella choica]|uniref:CopL family metal-binding regulatory protein n=1 Tax=Dyella choica TaxID=1927959 RepID=A0A432M2A0_9GAMM|nr:hypothetical protein [Dyella choica]RUL71866.1 hypothetical protein EKH80_18405 [Dyella choica]